MTQVNRTQYKQRQIATGTDQVIAAMPIPSGAVLTGVWGQVHMVVTASKVRGQAATYACQAYILPADLEGALNTEVDGYWDTIVPKDDDIVITAASVDIDVDTDNPDTTPFEEPGIININRVFGVAEHGQKVYSREKILTAANSGPVEPVASSEADLWMPTDSFRIRMRKKYRVERPSYLLFAISSPAWDQVTTGNEVMLTGSQWGMYQNMEVAMDLALPEVLGFTEAGAATPFHDVAELIERLLEPMVEEETAGSFATTTWDLWSKFSFQVTLAPKRSVGVLAG